MVATDLLQRDVARPAFLEIAIECLVEVLREWTDNYTVYLERCVPTANSRICILTTSESPSEASAMYRSVDIIGL